ncbi:MAG: SDR family NAD(P)-dependent oxidoreductase [Alphaproteobacteria bacterium]
MSEKTCIVVGVGPGLGGAVARRFAAGGHPVVVAARTGEKAEAVAKQITDAGGQALALAADATKEADVERVFAEAEKAFGPPGVAVFNASGRNRKHVADQTVEEFVSAWERSCLGGFLVARAAAQAMIPQKAGTILLTGATASMKGFPGSSSFAVGKFGLRALGESLARELHPQGVHVAHFNIDGGIGVNDEDSRLQPDAIAETYWQTHVQHRSAWSHSVEVRPWVESF